MDCLAVKKTHHPCSLLRGICSHAFLMQSAILPSLLEAQIDSPAPSARHSPRMPGFWLARERDSRCSGSFMVARQFTHLTAKAHVTDLSQERKEEEWGLNEKKMT